MLLLERRDVRADLVPSSDVQYELQQTLRRRELAHNVRIAGEGETAETYERPVVDNRMACGWKTRRRLRFGTMEGEMRSA